ncbi:hypothetical protein Gbro_0037 [Gordonia bronchialis DSM 43247]|uniref:Uncharacterized protein n=1 Tax=Gordonia bronchialis (strain ATCC 25592 / DSM 43247 / BCRC 13721 / JCM 3198 / KCTC 3076 / NBRC 16047 / NCTC 10667) TaxID=526226 RepID=D0LA66_GORB4|nr:hypothetical protein Gbro_0037 [Gordonia bronchialis DSM 43247]
MSDRWADMPIFFAAAVGISNANGGVTQGRKN